LRDAGAVILTDHKGRAVRLTAERRAHILEHPEMVGQFERVAETLAQPELVVATTVDENVHVYHRYYAVTPVTGKYLQVAVKLLTADAFVLTAFYSSRPKKGAEIWRA
jgi:predicted thioesterase